MFLEMLSSRVFVGVVIGIVLLGFLSQTWVTSFIKRRPDQAGMRVLPFAFMSCALFIALAIFIVSRPRAHERRLEWLKQHGEKVAAPITAIRQRTSVRINYQSPWVIFAAWQDPRTHRTYPFRSKTLGFDPRPRLSSSTIDVYLNPEDPTQYEMDLRAIYNTPPIDPYQQLRQTQQEVEHLKDQVAALEKKENRK